MIWFHYTRMTRTYVRHQEQLNHSIKLGKLRTKKAIHTIVLPNYLIQKKNEQ